MTNIQLALLGLALTALAIPLYPLKKAWLGGLFDMTIRYGRWLAACAYFAGACLILKAVGCI